MRRMVLFVLVIAIALLCAGCAFDCSRCKELEEELLELEWKYEDRIDELEQQLEDYERDMYNAITELCGYLGYIEENLEGHYYPVDVATALETAKEGMKYADALLY